MFRTAKILISDKPIFPYGQTLDSGDSGCQTPDLRDSGGSIIYNLKLGKWGLILVLFIILAGISGCLAAEIAIPADRGTIQDTADYAQTGNGIVVTPGIFEMYGEADAILPLQGTEIAEFYGDKYSKSDGITPEQTSGIITVDDDDNNIPVPPADYTTILDALASSVDGDTILVYAGNYTGYHEVASRVTLTGIGWPVVTGRANDPTNQIGDVFAFRADGCVLEGFDIREAEWKNATISSLQDSACVRIGYAAGTVSSWSFGDADSIIVRNNRLEDGWYGIIATTGSDNNLIYNNTISDTRYGAWFDYAKNNRFTNNIVRDTVNSPLKNTYFKSSVDSYPTGNQFEDNLFDSDEASYTHTILIEDTSGNLFKGNTLLNRTNIRIAGDGNTVSENTISGPSEHHFAAIHIDENGNTVLNNTIRNHKYGVLLEGGVDNLLMAGNTIEDCTYGFGYAGDLNYASGKPARNVIDTTNTVDGKTIYWVVGETGRTYNYSTLIPAPGYLALIGCSDCTVADFYLENNAQSLLIYRSDNISLNGISAHGNAYHGILVGESEDITITDSHADSNGQDAVDNSGYAGIYATDTERMQIIRSTTTANNPTGIFLQYSCPDVLIKDCTITNNGHSSEEDESYGIRNSGSDNARLVVTGCFIGNDFSTRQGIGIANHGQGAFIFNNRFFNNSIIPAENWGADTHWNGTPVSVINILGGPWTAGNFWDDYSGKDTTGDGLGDTSVPYTTGGGVPGEDYYPLVDTFIPDTKPPVIIIHAPVDGETYPAASVPLMVSSPDSDVATWWYALDNGQNLTFVPDIVLPLLDNGSHTLLVGARDEAGNKNSSVVTFMAEVDTTPPRIELISPKENMTYTSHEIPLTVHSPDSDVFSWWYTLDSGGNMAFIPNTTLTSIPNGGHLLRVFADDIIGNVNSTTVNFTVQVPEPTPTPTISPTPTPPLTPTPVPTPTPTPPDDGDDDATPADAYPFPIVEEPDFAIRILTPAPVRMTERFTEITYTAPRPLSRTYYQFDDGEMVQVTAGAAIPIGRLTLGTHTITVTGVDYYGRYGEGTIVFTVIPLALGEMETVGTDAYPDEATFSFTGQRGNYTLTFEAETSAEESVGVFINQKLTGVPGEGATVTKSASRNGQVATIADPRTGWQTYSVTVPDEMVVTDDENIISFIHATNPSHTDSLAEWHVRNINLAPSLQISAPSIEVFTPDQACGPDEDMMAWVKIKGVAPDDQYNATVYLIAPDGTEISFPEGTGDVTPLDGQSVTNNHNGRLPGSVIFSGENVPGTYQLVATLTPKGSSQLVSLSSVPVYYSATPSVNLYQNRPDLADGMPLRVTAAITRGEEDMDASLTVLLEPPEGPDLYLPGGTETFAATRMEPLISQYILLLDEPISEGWQDGTYTVRARLTGREGTPLAEDTITFTVSRDDGTLQLVFPRDVRIKTVTESRIRLTDISTREIVLERITDYPNTEITLDVPAGTYLVNGECTTADGGLWIIPTGSANQAVVKAGKTTVKELSFLTPMGDIYTEVST
ncbi:right-handed parallel beta-helix repeat-containing protein [Methanogenium marinum]|uniref:Right-handed parallel beta-helix repeat-containing protein n=1 Tax=Methanogenium marinum TaxID=348610 RepID=A0A9Q4PXQ7_9EURY|nr:NosD domain-containing protein [Methanogenium marinum]MDE4908921.1 right-handed parallel beta-helix repeat-containing protein [Methanogenium marinum]